ncbi:hypothetical protein [Cellulomonas fengjieae]|uniref:hypothetical protein n=1 Tax=Cellulomonas fengjieae TaxID=2819978 RepID=UPI001AAE8828|nr:hypothetical protein [Cellulomonas fengjieae]MBO3102553.1 hypothetical protein [Cellulomonas fengjieae]
MAHDPTHPDSVPTGTRRPERLSWPLVIGFGSLALLWPLVDALGLADSLGQPAAAFLVFAVVGAAWVLGVGFGRVPQPVVTLTLAGVVYGILLMAMSELLGDRPSIGGVLGGVVAVFEIARAAGLGALAGLLARSLQRSRAAR